MPIKNIQLKNGSKYPVGEAYREPITPGRQMDYNVEYDAEATDYATGVFGYYMTAAGADTIETISTAKMWPVKSGSSNIGTLTQDELAAASVRMYIDGVPPLDFGDVILMDTNEVAMFFAEPIIDAMSSSMGTPLELDANQVFSDLPGSCCLSSKGAIGIGLALASFPEAVTESVYSEITLNEGAITIRFTLTVPASGSYWATTVPEINLSAIDFDAVVSICRWNIDRRFIESYVTSFQNDLFIEQTQTNGEFDLIKSPAILAKLTDAVLYQKAIIWGGVLFEISTAYTSWQDRSGTKHIEIMGVDLADQSSAKITYSVES